MIAHLAKFGGVGIAATLLHVAVALLAATLFSAAPMAANFAGFCAAVLLSYFGHARLSFEVDLAHAVHGPRFLLSALTGLVASSAITWAGQALFGLPFWMTMMLVGTLVPLITYLLLRLWVFSPGAAGASEALPSLLVALAPALVLLGLNWDSRVHHDIAWYLIGAGRMLDGGALYVDVVEINPPLAFYLTIPTVLLARATGIALGNAHFLVVATILFASLRLCWPLVRRAGLGIGAAAAFLLIAGAVVLFYGGYNVGQREQLFILMVLPWLLQQALPPAGRAGADDVAGNSARALLAAIGICLKPFFLALPILLTLWRMWRARSWRPLLDLSNWILLAFGLAYVALVVIVHPAYLADIVPTGRLVYGAYSVGLRSILLQLPQPLLMLAIVAVLGWRQRALWQSVPGALVVASLAGVAAYLLQWAGFKYHALPMISFAALALAWLAVTRVRALPLSLLALAPVFYAMISGPHRLTPSPAVHDALDRAIGPARSVMLFSTDLYPVLPIAVDRSIAWASRYPALWLVPGPVNALAQLDCTAHAARCAALEAPLARTRADVVADMKRHRPEVLVIDVRSPFLAAPGFDWIAFLSQSPDFAPLFKAYRREQQLGRFDVWRRQP